MIYFLTSNKGKFKEVREFLLSKEIEINHLNLSIEEPRGTLESVSLYKAKKGYEKIKSPVFADDSGLFINSLNGFPGEFSSWVYEKIGLEGILALLKEKEDRTAYFKSVISYYDGKNSYTFEGRVYGTISYEIRGNSEKGLPYDSIFIPKGYEKTFAENYEVKKKLSHRIRALEKFSSFICTKL